MKKQAKKQIDILTGTVIGLTGFSVSKGITSGLEATATPSERAVLRAVPTLTLTPTVIGLTQELEPKKKGKKYALW